MSFFNYREIRTTDVSAQALQSPSSCLRRDHFLLPPPIWAKQKDPSKNFILVKTKRVGIDATSLGCRGGKNYETSIYAFDFDGHSICWLF